MFLLKFALCFWWQSKSRRVFTEIFTRTLGTFYITPFPRQNFESKRRLFSESSILKFLHQNYHLLSSTAKKIIFEHAKFSNVTCLTVNRMRIKIFNFQMLTRTWCTFNEDSPLEIRLNNSLVWSDYLHVILTTGLHF